MTTVDLNADCGESFGPWNMGDDAAILSIVTSANVACGFHAGDPDTMLETFTTAKERGGLLIDKAVGDAFIIPQRGHGAARGLFAALNGAQYRARYAGREARQGLAFELGERGNARDLFDQIGLAQHIGPPGRDMGHIAVQPEAQCR